LFKIPDLWGVINLTPDSFYADSRATVSEAVQRATTMLEEGAQVIDVGAESTRPGAEAVSAETQVAVLKPFLQSYASALGPDALRRISVDTRDIAVMQAVTDLGAGYINDVSGGTPEVFKLVAATRVGYVLMHAKGSPANMQVAPEYRDVTAEVEGFLIEKTGQLKAAGVRSEQIIWDTGIGFGKTLKHNLKLIAAHPRFRADGHRILAGVSRKSFIGKILQQDRPEDRLIGTLAAQTYLTLHGCDILRVHDVKEMAETLKVIGAIAEHEL
jgi:dihydropteroate synthase